MRIIDADTIKIPPTSADIFENCRNCKLLDEYQVKEIIDNAPTVDVEPIRHGKWIYDLRYTPPKCSECGKRIHSGDWSEECNFCGHCGAKMDGERKEK